MARPKGRQPLAAPRIVRMSLQGSLAKHGAVPYGIAALATLAATGLIELIYHLEPVPNVSLLYVPVVLACATWFGLGAALTASVLSIAEYDYFLITPRLTFSVDRLDDILALLVLSIVAITAAHLAKPHAQPGGRGGDSG